MYKKIILGLILILIVLPLVSAGFRRDVYDYQGSYIRQKVNYSLFDSINYTGTRINITGNLTLGQKITFTLGEIIDNFINDWIRITGGLNVTENITAKNYLNESGDLEWIGPEHIFDVDDADIESDLNTYVDIAGDTMAGDLQMPGVNINGSGNVTTTGIGTFGEVVINQQADDVGLKIYGYDDKSSDYVSISLFGSGYGRLDASENMIFSANGNFKWGYNENFIYMIDDYLLTFGDEDNWGIKYNYTANALQFISMVTVDDIVRFTINSTGEVGIGTTNPLSKLYIKDDDQTTGASMLTLESDDGPSIKLDDTGAGDYWTINTGGVDTNLYFNYNGEGVAGNKVFFGYDGNVIINGTTSDNTFKVYGDGNITTNLTVGDTGFFDRVGIGGAPNVGKLHIFNAGIHGVIFEAVPGSGGSGGRFRFKYLSNNPFIEMRKGTGASGSGVFIDTNGDSFFNGGNVGIGTATPSEELDVVGDIGISQNIRFGGSTETPSYSYTNGIFWPQGSELIEQTTGAGGSDRMLYLPNGDRFEVLNEAGSDFIAAFHGANSGTANRVILYKGTVIADGYAGSFDNAAPPAGGMIVEGNVGINTTSPTHALNVVGDVNITGKIYNSLAHAFGLATETFAVAAADTWYNITMNRTHADTVGFALSVDNITMTVPHDGHYTITFGMGIMDSDNSPSAHVGMRVEVNGAELLGSYVEYDTHRQATDYWLEHTTHTELSEDDEIRLQYISSADTVTISQEDTYATQGFSAFGYLQEVME